MTEPLSLAVLGGVAATESIKFLYAQASELLKAWRERRRETATGEDTPTELVVPIVDNDVLAGTPISAVADAAEIDRLSVALIPLVGALSPYALGQVDIDVNDEELGRQAGRLRALLEAAYGRRLTFRDEQRAPASTRITVTQVLAEIEGSVIGANAKLEPGTDLVVEQRADIVRPHGTVIGFTDKPA
jgi:hypothetical protein